MNEGETWDVAIVGGGVIGLACAFELARRRQAACCGDSNVVSQGSQASRDRGWLC